MGDRLTFDKQPKIQANYNRAKALKLEKQERGVSRENSEHCLLKNMIQSGSSVVLLKTLIKGIDNLKLTKELKNQNLTTEQKVQLWLQKLKIKTGVDLEKLNIPSQNQHAKRSKIEENKISHLKSNAIKQTLSKIIHGLCTEYPDVKTPNIGDYQACFVFLYNSRDKFEEYILTENQKKLAKLKKS